MEPILGRKRLVSRQGCLPAPRNDVSRERMRAALARPSGFSRLFQNGLNLELIQARNSHDGDQGNRYARSMIKR